ncbi:GTP cyclohydrolase I FolE [Gracilibacillus xinjiangensis]|uniref:GTP cyclohydrolase 1 n=1 Tax=Gracilibacillus xinjiangensis TaxID=1193282 RepID=A0ABV8WS02_9BACI
MTIKEIEKASVAKYIRAILEAIGEDPNREGLQDTPNRVANMYIEVFAGIGVDPKTALTTTFDAENYEGMIVVKDIDYYTFCEHHLIPFFGKVDIGYIPNDKIVGLSKFARLTEIVSKRPQVQERMTKQIADAIEGVLNPKGVIVSVEGQHLCMCARGVKKTSSATVTTLKLGIFKENSSIVREFERSILTK